MNYEFRCTENGFYYYDPVLRKERFASNTLLFLIGYARSFGDSYVSDKLFIPNTVLDADGIPVALTNIAFQKSARRYLTNLDRVEVTDSGDLFELYGLTLVLEQIGFFNYYSSSNSNFTKLNRVPHIPLFTKRSQDYVRIYEILTQKEYWGEGKPSKGNPNLLHTKINTSTRLKQDTVYPLYSVYNTSYQGNRAESIELYDSFGSWDYMENMYSSLLKPVNQYDDMCSWFVWNSLSFTTLYHFSLGALYGMSQLGYGSLPFTSRPIIYAKGFKYLQYIDEAFFWFQNTPLDLIFPNQVFYLDARLFRINTYTPEYETNRILSSSVDQDYFYDSETNLYSVDNGQTWINRTDFYRWADVNNGAYPVTSYTTSLYRGGDSLDLPLSDWEW